MRAFPFVMCALATVAPSLSNADTPSDALRCEALRLKKESGYHMCLARCEVRAERSDRFDTARCEESCQRSLHLQIQRVDNKPICTEAPADPVHCEAKILKIEASHLFCQSRCERRAEHRADYDAVTCLTDCGVQSDAAYGEAMGSATCAAGRMEGGS